MLPSLKIHLKDESKYFSCCFKILQWRILFAFDNGETSMVFLFSAAAWGMWDLNSLARHGSVESKLLDCQGSPKNCLVDNC